MSRPRRDEEPDEADAWRAIVDNYGERPQWEEPRPQDPTPAAPAESEHAVDLDADSDLQRGPHEHFRPPPPPPLPLATPRRLVAWVGVFGVPLVVLVALVLGLLLPTIVGVVLMLWFVGGFCYLVASMRPGRDDDPDDGAVL